jgi:pterin-4a-carbinolamine dehydratase
MTELNEMKCLPCEGGVEPLTPARAHLANLEDHHPDLEVGYGYCRVAFTTHAIKGLSENDFICAAKIDLIPLN